MWYNPKLPKWATRQMEKNSQAALFASQQMASHMESGYCQPPPGAQPAPSQATKQVAAVSREVAKEHRMLARTPGKRVVVRPCCEAKWGQDKPPNNENSTTIP